MTKFQQGNPYRFRPGNPGGGRPRKAPITEHLRDILAEFDPRTQKEIAREIAEAVVTKAKKGSVSHAEFVRDTVEGKPVQRQAIIVQSLSPADLQEARALAASLRAADLAERNFKP